MTMCIRLLAALAFLVVAEVTDRPALAAPPPDVAVNVDGFADWMSSRAYVDASAMFRRWGRAGAGWEENPRLALTDDNLPLMDADAVTLLRGYPVGVYKLRYEGAASINFVG